MGIWTHDLHDTCAMLYQLTYEVSLEAGQEWVHFIPLYEEIEITCARPVSASVATVVMCELEYNLSCFDS